MYRAFIGSFLFFIFVLGQFSCKENYSQKKNYAREKGKPCPDFLHCEYINPYMYEIHLEGFIKDDKFIGQSVSYCSVHEEERKKRKGKEINGLKVGVYNWNESIDYEEDVYLLDKQEPDKKGVIFYLSDGFLNGQVIRIMNLSEESTDVKILAEIIRKDIPKQNPRSYSCKKQAFHFPPEQTSQPE